MKLILSYFLVFWTSMVWAQFDTFPCEKANTLLKQLASGKTINQLYVHDCSGTGMGNMSSSFLSASGKAPARTTDPEDSNWNQYEKWTCKYSAGNISDKNKKTAWVEGVAGYGIGELVLVGCLDFNKPIRIWNGYGKSKNLFEANTRVKLARVHIIRAEMHDVTQYGTVHSNLKAIATNEVMLLDKNGFQKLSVPKFTATKHFNERMQQELDYTYFLAIEIRSVYKGSKYQDTCISEVNNEQ